MRLVDTHCHIHSAKYFDQEDVSDVITRATDAGVQNMVCIGTSVDESKEAIDFCRSSELLHPTIGIHPHEAATDLQRWDEFAALLSSGSGVVGIGECGLDYWYEHSDREAQEKVLRLQLDLAVSASLPVSFHIRNSRDDHKRIVDGEDIIGDAYVDLLRIMDDYKGKLRGVIHSFSTGQKELNSILSLGFSVGVNGIATFTSDQVQLDAYRAIPLDRMVLETDAPYLAPKPLRGKSNEPAYLTHIVRFLSELRGESEDEIATTTTVNAKKLFNL